MEDRLRQILEKITVDPLLHARWLNTLSCLENCGARKIARCQHPTLVRREMLKHAAEEFRHAYHLKHQISKLGIICETYSTNDILGGFATLQYLDRLEIAVCRFLKNDFQLAAWDLKEWAYWLVTYAIEVRAKSLYPLYQNMLNKAACNISVRFIIAEEEQHLADIGAQIDKLEFGDALKAQACACESRLFEVFLTQTQLEID